jgi:hypothetical protein
MYVCMYVCMYVFMCVYSHIHTERAEREGERGRERERERERQRERERKRGRGSNLRIHVPQVHINDGLLRQINVDGEFPQSEDYCLVSGDAAKQAQQLWCRRILENRWRPNKASTQATD